MIRRDGESPNVHDQAAAQSHTDSTDLHKCGDSPSAATVEPEIEVSDETLAKLRYIARKLDCNVQAALEEVVREFKPHIEEDGFEVEREGRFW